MPDYKTTFFLEGYQSSDGYGTGAALGWTETWYQTLAGGLDAALTNPQVAAYVAARRGCLSPAYRLAWCRVSDVANPRSSKMLDLGAATGQAAGGLAFSAPVYDSMLIDFTVLPLAAPPVVEPAHHRRFHLRGLMRVDFDNNVIAAISPNGQAVAKFLNLVGNGTIGAQSLPQGILPYWKIRFYDPAVSAVPVTGVQVNPASQFQLIVGQPGGFLIGDRVLISGIKNLPTRANRIWTVMATSNGPPATITLGNARRPLAGTWDGTGFIRKVNAYVYRGASQYLYIGARHKSCGRPSRLTRGRRRRAS